MPLLKSWSSRIWRQKNAIAKGAGRRSLNSTVLWKFLRAQKVSPSINKKKEKKKETIFFLWKSQLKKSCKTTLHEDLDHASRILDLKGKFFFSAYSTFKMRSSTCLMANRMKETQGRGGRFPGQSTKNNTVWGASGREQQVENTRQIPLYL